jgi:hypothetical protein
VKLGYGFTASAWRLKKRKPLLGGGMGLDRGALRFTCQQQAGDLRPPGGRLFFGWNKNHRGL